MRDGDNIYIKEERYFALPQFRFLGLFLFVYVGVNIHKYGIVYYGAEFIVAAISIFLMVATTGYQIDFSKKLHREYISAVNFYYGKWIAFPELDYVTVFVVNVVETGGGVAVRLHYKHKDVRVRIIGKSREIFDVGNFTKKEEAFEVGRMCAVKLKIRLLDYTEREPKWIEIDNNDKNPGSD